MQKPSRTKRALLIGITDYPKLPFSSKKLSGCINDVNLMSKLLPHRFRFTADKIKILRNEQATRDGILKAFEDLVANVEEGDVIVVYFAGHGSHARVQDVAKKGSGWVETIVPYDSGRNSTGHRSTDITDIEMQKYLLEPLLRKTHFISLFFDSCHSASILREDFGTAVRGIDPDGEIRKNHDIDNTEVSGWLPTPSHRSGESLSRGYILLAACRAHEKAFEITTKEKTYGAFTYLLCKLINETHNDDMRTIFRLASAEVTARFPQQHPILEGARDALVFGTHRLETLRYLPIKRVETHGGSTLVEMDGGLASGVTCGSIWAIRPLGTPPQKSDAQIKIKEAFAFVSRAEVIHQGRIEGTYGCFEVLHDYGSAALNILVDSREFLSKIGTPHLSGSLNVVENTEDADMKVVRLQPRAAVAKGDLLPQLGPLDRTIWAALSRDGRPILPPTTNLPGLVENLRKLARYQFGLALRNIDELSKLRGKMTLQLRRCPKGHLPWQNVPTEMDGFPHFQVGDHIACIITNNSAVAVWPCILEFAEDGSVKQRYPNRGGEEVLASGRSTKEVARMSLDFSSDEVFQLERGKVLLGAQDGESRSEQTKGRRPRKRITEMLKLFASTEPVDLSLLLQDALVTRRGGRDLFSLLQPGVSLRRDDNCAWWTVEEPFVLESDPLDTDSEE